MDRPIILLAGIFFILLVGRATAQAFFDWSDLPPALVLLFIVYCLVAHRWASGDCRKE
jgi:hypothetical protein